MKIIDSNKDYYDYLQNIWRDDTVTFDRWDSYDLSKEEFAGTFLDESYKWSEYWLKSYPEGDKHKYVLLQVCNQFWLFDLMITKTGDKGICLDYELRQNETWQDYTRPAEFIRLSAIRPPYSYYYQDHPEEFADAVKRGEYKTEWLYNRFTTSKSKGAGCVEETRHIPILKNIGIAALVPAESIFLALEEFFLTQRQNLERTESMGLTDLEKVTNHGFDAKTSFRGR